MITFKQSGSFNNIDIFFNNARISYSSIFKKYAERGLSALINATPKDSGKTASSWSYEIIKSKGKTSIIWSNSNIVNNIPIAVVLQYGHATKSGGFVQGKDYINPALKPIFDEMANELWKEVTRQ